MALCQEDAFLATGFSNGKVYQIVILLRSTAIVNATRKLVFWRGHDILHINISPVP